MRSLLRRIFLFIRYSSFIVGVIFLLALSIYGLWYILNWYLNPTTSEQRTELIKAVGQILTGIGLLLGIYFTRRTLQLNREGQITERFTRAIDQLGATDNDGKKRLELRLGG